MKTGFIIAVSVAGGIVFLLVVLNMVFSTIRKRLEKYVQDRFDPDDIIGATTRANFFGQQSKRGKQLRGNGALVLTRDQLCFVRAMPVREYILPMESITHLSMPKSFNGKSVFAPLLCVHYHGEDGEDAMAWSLKDPQKWITAIEATR